MKLPFRFEVWTDERIDENCSHQSRSLRLSFHLCESRLSVNIYLCSLNARKSHRGVRFAVANNLVIHSELALGHSRQIALHCYSACDMRIENFSTLAHQKIDAFQYVKKNFVSAIFNSFTSPANLAGYGRSHMRGLLTRRLSTQRGQAEVIHCSL